jgi:hypothetical protein
MGSLVADGHAPAAMKHDETRSEATHQVRDEAAGAQP